MSIRSTSSTLFLLLFWLFPYQLNSCSFQRQTLKDKVTKAIRCNRMDKLKKICEKSFAEDTILEIAINEESEPTLDLLLQLNHLGFAPGGGWGTGQHDSFRKTLEALNKALLLKKLRTIEWFLSHHIDLNHTEDYIELPLTVAALEGNISLIDRLRQAGALINHHADYHPSPLLAICSNSTLVAVSTHLLNLPDINANIIDRRNNTPLHLVAKKVELAGLAYLMLQKGAQVQVNLCNLQQHTPVDIAVLHDNVPFLQIIEPYKPNLLKKWPSNPPINLALEAKQWNAFIWLAQRDSIENEFRATELVNDVIQEETITEEHKVRLLTALIDHHAIRFQRDRLIMGGYSISPLEHALKLNLPIVIKLLVIKGALYLDRISRIPNKTALRNLCRFLRMGGKLRTLMTLAWLAKAKFLPRQACYWAKKFFEETTTPIDQADLSNGLYHAMHSIERPQFELALLLMQHGSRLDWHTDQNLQEILQALTEKNAIALNSIEKCHWQECRTRRAHEAAASSSSSNA